MKRKLTVTIFFIAMAFSFAKAQKAENGKVIITGSRFVYPLLDQWIAEFGKEYPEVKFRLIPRGGPNVDSANLIINAHTLYESEIKPGYKVVNISRYAILPVANAKSQLAKEAQEKGIKEAQLKKLFFKKYDPFAAKKVEKSNDKSAKPVLYTRAQKACAPTTFARNYGFEQDDIIGKPIGGDDKHLIVAIEKDTNGVTYNSLGLIYDLNTRQVKPGIAVLPIDLNNNGKLDDNEKFYNNLDEVIARLEQKTLSEIPVSFVNVSYPLNIDASNKNLSLFLSWILENGQKFNHEYGYLDFEKNTLADQKEILSQSTK